MANLSIVTITTALVYVPNASAAHGSSGSFGPGSTTLSSVTGSAAPPIAVRPISSRDAAIACEQLEDFIGRDPS